MKVNVILVNNKVAHVIEDYQKAIDKYRELKNKAILAVYGANDKYELDEDIDAYSISINIKSPTIQSIKMFNCDVE